MLLPFRMLFWAVEHGLLQFFVAWFSCMRMPTFVWSTHNRNTIIMWSAAHSKSLIHQREIYLSMVVVRAGYEWRMDNIWCKNREKKWWCDFIYFVWSSQKIKTPLSEYIIHTPVEWLASFLCFALMVLCYHTLQEHVLSYAYIQVLMCLPINLHCDKHNFYHFSLHSDEHRVCHWTTHTHTYFMYFSLPLVVCIAP